MKKPVLILPFSSAASFGCADPATAVQLGLVEPVMFGRNQLTGPSIPVPSLPIQISDHNDPFQVLR